MSESTNASSGGVGISGLLVIVFLVMKLTEKLSFWGDHFPRFLKSTPAWWDGWFMVFLPLWAGLAIALVIFLIALLVAFIKNR